MKLTIESTGQITHIEGVRVRLWLGRTESGRPVDVFVLQFRTDDAAAKAELKREQIEGPRPVELDIEEIEERRRRERLAEN